MTFLSYQLPNVLSEIKLLNSFIFSQKQYLYRNQKWGKKKEMKGDKKTPK